MFINTRQIKLNYFFIRFFLSVFFFDDFNLNWKITFLTLALWVLFDNIEIMITFCHNDIFACEWEGIAIQRLFNINDIQQQQQHINPPPYREKNDYMKEIDRRKMYTLLCVYWARSEKRKENDVWDWEMQREREGIVVYTHFLYFHPSNDHDCHRKNEKLDMCNVYSLCFWAFFILCLSAERNK